MQISSPTSSTCEHLSQCQWGSGKHTTHAVRANYLRNTSNAASLSFLFQRDGPWDYQLLEGPLIIMCTAALARVKKEMGGKSIADTNALRNMRKLAGKIHLIVLPVHSSKISAT